MLGRDDERRLVHFLREVRLGDLVDQPRDERLAVVASGDVQQRHLQEFSFTDTSKRYPFSKMNGTLSFQNDQRFVLSFWKWDIFWKYLYLLIFFLFLLNRIIIRLLNYTQFNSFYRLSLRHSLFHITIANKNFVLKKMGVLFTFFHFHFHVFCCLQNPSSLVRQ